MKLVHDLTPEGHWKLNPFHKNVRVLRRALQRLPDMKRNEHRVTIRSRLKENVALKLMKLSILSTYKNIIYKTNLNFASILSLYTIRNLLCFRITTLNLDLTMTLLVTFSGKKTVLQLVAMILNPNSVLSMLTTIFFVISYGIASFHVTFHYTSCRITLKSRP